MSASFSLLVMQLRSVYDLPDRWTPDVLRQILAQAAFEDIDEIELADLREMTVMALQDLKPEKAAEAVLAVLAPDLSVGVRQNLAQDMKRSRMWEEYANPAAHAAIFLTAVLMNQAFPRVYPRPDIARLILQVTAEDEAAVTGLGNHMPAVAARLVAAGMDAHSTLCRLYAAQLAGGSFPEAAAIIWQVQERSLVANVAEWVIYASWYWLRPLQSGRAYDATIQLD